jgi:hypothetical protein
MTMDDSTQAAENQYEQLANDINRKEADRGRRLVYSVGKDVRDSGGSMVVDNPLGRHGRWEAEA